MTLCVLRSEAAYRVVDRNALLRWLLSLRQPDGSFRLHSDGEIDVRYALRNCSRNHFCHLQSSPNRKADRAHPLLLRMSRYLRRLRVLGTFANGRLSSTSERHDTDRLSMPMPMLMLMPMPN